MIKIYGGRRGTAFRNHWMLAEINVPYETVSLDMQSQEHKQPAFLALNPNGQVPVLVDGDFVLTESVAINDYLATKHAPQLLGTTPEHHALIMQWSIWALVTINRFFGDIAELKFKNIVDEKVTAQALEKLQRFMPILDTHLKGKDFMVGGEFSVADVNIIPALNYGHFVNFDFSPYAEVVRYMGLMAARPMFIKASQES